MTDRLRGQTAVVTGASRGIGAATARALARAGARVALLSRSERELRALADEIGTGAFPVPADLMDPGSLEAAISTVQERLGVPDIVVNGAGAFRVAPAASLSPDVFNHVVELNLIVPFRVMRAFLPRMLARGSGHIVSLGSVADRHAFPENAAYAASKFGLRGLHEVLRGELRGSGVRATLVSPAAVDTPLWDQIEATAEPGRFPARADMLNPEAVADAILYAVSRPEGVEVEELRVRKSG